MRSEAKALLENKKHNSEKLSGLATELSVFLELYGSRIYELDKQMADGFDGLPHTKELLGKIASGICGSDKPADINALSILSTLDTPTKRMFGANNKQQSPEASANNSLNPLDLPPWDKRATYSPLRHASSRWQDKLGKPASELER